MNCSHDSSQGINQGDGPNKIWRCDVCDSLYRLTKDSQGISHQIPIDLFTCNGCHDGYFPDFDHFVEVMDVKPDELGEAFAAWMATTTEWDGKAEKI